MKRLFALLAVVGLLAVIPLTHGVQGDDTPTDKFDVCHSNGKVLSVDVEGLADHLGHGDCAYIADPTDTGYLVRLFQTGLLTGGLDDLCVTCPE